MHDYNILMWNLKTLNKILHPQKKLFSEHSFQNLLKCVNWYFTIYVCNIVLLMLMIFECLSCTLNELLRSLTYLFLPILLFQWLILKIQEQTTSVLLIILSSQKFYTNTKCSQSSVRLKTKTDPSAEQRKPGVCALDPFMSCCYGWRKANGVCQREQFNNSICIFCHMAKSYL